MPGGGTYVWHMFKTHPNSVSFAEFQMCFCWVALFYWLDLVIRPSYVRDGSCKQDDRDGSDGGEGTCSSYGIQRASRSHGGSAASWCSAATGDREGHGANIDSGRRGKEGSGGEGASGTNEESGALELNGEENCSETDGPGLERPASQDFEHQQEVMHYLKRMSSSPCDCVSSCDMSHFQPFQIYFKLLSKSLKYF